MVFSINRAKEPTSQLSVYANALGTPVAVDAVHRADNWLEVPWITIR